MTSGISRSPSFGPALYSRLDKPGGGIIGGRGQPLDIRRLKIGIDSHRVCNCPNSLGWSAIEELIDQRCSGVLVRLAPGGLGFLQCTGLLLKFGVCCFAGIV